MAWYIAGVYLDLSKYNTKHSAKTQEFIQVFRDSRKIWNRGECALDYFTPDTTKSVIENLKDDAVRCVPAILGLVSDIFKKIAERTGTDATNSIRIVSQIKAVVQGIKPVSGYVEMVMALGFAPASGGWSSLHTTISVEPAEAANRLDAALLDNDNLLYSSVGVARIIRDDQKFWMKEKGGQWLTLTTDDVANLLPEFQSVPLDVLDAMRRQCGAGDGFISADILHSPRGAVGALDVSAESQATVGVNIGLWRSTMNDLFRLHDCTFTAADGAPVTIRRLPTALFGDVDLAYQANTGASATTSEHLTMITLLKRTGNYYTITNATVFGDTPNQAVVMDVMNRQRVQLHSVLGLPLPPTTR
jgi:hypothetical protein